MMASQPMGEPPSKPAFPALHLVPPPVRRSLTGMRVNLGAREVAVRRRMKLEINNHGTGTDVDALATSMCVPKSGGGRPWHHG